MNVTFSGGKASSPLPISQIAIVVRDIDDALEKYNRVLGWWNAEGFANGAPADLVLGAGFCSGASASEPTGIEKSKRS